MADTQQFRFERQESLQSWFSNVYQSYIRSHMPSSQRNLQIPWHYVKSVILIKYLDLQTVICKLCHPIKKGLWYKDRLTSNSGEIALTQRSPWLRWLPLRNCKYLQVFPKKRTNLFNDNEQEKFKFLDTSFSQQSRWRNHQESLDTLQEKSESRASVGKKSVWMRRSLWDWLCFQDFQKKAVDAKRFNCNCPNYW